MSNNRKGMGLVRSKPEPSSNAPAAKSQAQPQAPGGMQRVRIEPIPTPVPVSGGAGVRPPLPPTGISQRNILNTKSVAVERQQAARDAGFDTQMIPLSEIQLDPSQPRQRSRYRDEDAGKRKEEIEELAKSIGREGLRHPVEVEELVTAIGTPSAYRLIVGETRLKAYQHLAKTDASWLTIPAFVKRSLTLAERRLHQFSENYYRKQLTPVEEAEALNLMRFDLATVKGATEPLPWKDLPGALPGLTPAAAEHCCRISQLPDSAKDLLRARHQPARSTIVRAVQTISLADEDAVLAALRAAIRKSEAAASDQSMPARTDAAREARRQGIVLRRFTKVKVDVGQGPPISLDVRVGLAASEWEAIQRDTAARRRHETDTWRRVKEAAESKLASLEGGAVE